jgi:hypothetical protein
MSKNSPKKLVKQFRNWRDNRNNQVKPIRLKRYGTVSDKDDKLGESNNGRGNKKGRPKGKSKRIKERISLNEKESRYSRTS